MDSRGYTRRDYRHRRRRSRKEREQMLDKLLKIFFYILIALVIIILIKVIFLKENDGSSSNNNSPSKENYTEKNDDNSEISGEDSSDSSSSENNSSTGDASSDTSSSQKEQTSTETPTTTEPQTTETPTESYVPSGEYSVLDNAAFVGDSRVGGLFLSSQLMNPKFFYDVGGNVKSALTEKAIKLDNGSYGTMIDALKQKEFEYIFIQYGVNEWGWNNDSFISRYGTLIDEIKAVQPNAKIYALAIIPVTAKFATDRAGDAMNVNLKLDQMDALLKTLASEKGIGYINIVEGITGGERVLAPGMSSDGYHLNRTENMKLLDYICNYLK